MDSPFTNHEAALPRLWRGLRRRFSPSRHFRREHGLERLVEGGAAQEWVLARGLCAYTLIDAAAVPPRKRPGFVGIAVARWAPFADPASHVEWAGDRAMVWAWSRSGLLEDASGKLHPAPVRVLPESLLRGEPRTDGEALVAMDHGVEARVWRDQQLVASQWWEHAPSLAEWNGFRRGAGLPPAAVLPPVDTPVLSAAPWTRRRVRALGDVAQEYRRHLAAVTVAIAVAAVGVPLVSSAKLGLASYQLQREIEGQGPRLQRILDAREAAGRDVDGINRLLQLRPPAGQLRLLAAVSALVPAGSGELLEWRMPDASNLEVTLRMASPDPAGLARAWEASEVFDQATVELGPNPQEVRISARIVRPSAAGGSR